MEQQVRGSQAKGMPDMRPGGVCEDNTPYSMHTSLIKEAPFCTDQWEHHPHYLDQDKYRVATDGNTPLGKDDLEHHADEQLEEYVNELVRALHMVNKSTHNMDIAHRKEAIKFTADALLVRRATGMAWSDALSKRVSNYCNKSHVLAHGHQGTESPDVAEIAGEDPDYIASMECASSSSIRTPVSSEGTNSCEFSDQDFGANHHGSTASLASSDHSSIVVCTNELLHDDIDALNYVESGVSLRLMDIVSSSDAHMSSVNSSGELLSTCNQVEKQRKSEDQLHEEINARLAMIRSCCKETNEDAGIAKKPPANVKDYHLMRKDGLHDQGASHAGEVRKSFHVVHHDVPCGRADVAHSELTQYFPTAVSQLPCAYVQNGNAFQEALGSSDTDVARNVVNTVHDMAPERADVAPCNIAEVTLGALSNGDVEGGDMTGLQGMQMRGKAATDDVDGKEGGQVDSGVEGALRCQQQLTWQDSMYVASRADVAGTVLCGAELGGTIRNDLQRGNMREMMYRVAAYQPINWESIMEEVVGKERPRRRNVRISKEPQSVAARRRRERISDRIRILQHLVPGTSKLDTASMLDEAIHYLKFLKLQVQALQRVDTIFTSLPLPTANSDCPCYLAPRYPFHHSPSTSTSSHCEYHPFSLQM